MTMVIMMTKIKIGDEDDFNDDERYDHEGDNHDHDRNRGLK